MHVLCSLNGAPVRHHTVLQDSTTADCAIRNLNGSEVSQTKLPSCFSAFAHMLRETPQVHMVREFPHQMTRSQEICMGQGVEGGGRSLR